MFLNPGTTTWTDVCKEKPMPVKLRRWWCRSRRASLDGSFRTLAQFFWPFNYDFLTSHCLYIVHWIRLVLESQALHPNRSIHPLIQSHHFLCGKPKIKAAKWKLNPARTRAALNKVLPARLQGNHIFVLNLWHSTYYKERYYSSPFVRCNFEGPNSGMFWPVWPTALSWQAASSHNKLQSGSCVDLNGVAEGTLQIPDGLLAGKIEHMNRLPRWCDELFKYPSYSGPRWCEWPAWQAEHGSVVARHKEFEFHEMATLQRSYRILSYLQHVFMTSDFH